MSKTSAKKTRSLDFCKMMNCNKLSSMTSSGYNWYSCEFDKNGNNGANYMGDLDFSKYSIDKCIYKHNHEQALAVENLP